MLRVLSRVTEWHLSTFRYPLFTVFDTFYCIGGVSALSAYRHGHTRMIRRLSSRFPPWLVIPIFLLRLSMVHPFCLLDWLGWLRLDRLAVSLCRYTRVTDLATDT